MNVLSTVRQTFALCGLLAVGASAARADELPRSAAFFDAASAESAPARCGDFVNATFGKRGDPAKKRGHRTDGIVVLKDGQVVYEQYRAPWTHDAPHCLWSASKSVTHALLGAAIQDPRLADKGISLETKLADWYPRANAPSAYGRIRIEDLVHMGAGFDWSESYAAGLRNSSVTRMYYVDEFTDMAGFAASRPMIPEGPGRKWNYSSGNSNLIMGILGRAYARPAYDAMPWENFFDVLGMENAAMERDGAGTFVGATYVHMRPTDMAKVGLLYLNDGMWNGRRILPRGWVDHAKTMAQVYREDPAKVESLRDDGVYGGGWWLNVEAAFKAKSGNEVRSYPKTEEGMYGAFGHYGQYIFVLPSQKLVIARTGNDFDFSLAKDLDNYFVSAAKCFGGEE